MHPAGGAAARAGSRPGGRRARPAGWRGGGRQRSRKEGAERSGEEGHPWRVQVRGQGGGESGEPDPKGGEEGAEHARGARSGPPARPSRRRAPGSSDSDSERIHAPRSRPGSRPSTRGPAASPAPAARQPAVQPAARQPAAFAGVGAGASAARQPRVRPRKVRSRASAAVSSSPRLARRQRAGRLPGWAASGPPAHAEALSRRYPRLSAAGRRDNLRCSVTRMQPGGPVTRMLRPRGIRPLLPLFSISTIQSPRPPQSFRLNQPAPLNSLQPSRPAARGRA
jgi:hypothetical protein